MSGQHDQAAASANRREGLRRLDKARSLISGAIRLGEVTGAEALEAARLGVSEGAENLAGDIREEAGLARI